MSLFKAIQFLAVVLCLTLGLGGCDDEDVIKAAAAKGIFLQKKQVEDPPGSGKLTEKYVVVNDPTQSKVDNAIGTAQGLAGGVPIAAQVIGILAFLSSLGGNLLQKKLQAIADKKNAELAAANEEHVNTQAATKIGLQTAVNAMAPDQAKILVQHLDAAHDALDVDPAHQDGIQPVLKPA